MAIALLCGFTGASLASAQVTEKKEAVASASASVSRASSATSASGSSSASVKGTNCELPIAVVIGKQAEEIPEAARSVLENSLTRMATASGMNADFHFSNFVLTAQVDVLDKDILPGPPMQISRTLGVTLYLGDAATQTKYASAYVEVAGVGTNDTKCLINAFRRLNAGNAEIKRMIALGKQKMMTYFDDHYGDILQNARRKAALQQYEEAIALAMSIPVCSRGGDEATAAALEIYATCRDKLNLELLNRARTIWAAGQNREAAVEAGRLLSLIDPDAACYSDAVALAEEIKRQIRSDLDFVMREQYADQVRLEEARIEAIRAIGVAYGRGQQPRTTHITWVR